MGFSSTGFAAAGVRVTLAVPVLFFAGVGSGAASLSSLGVAGGGIASLLEAAAVEGSAFGPTGFWGEGMAFSFAFAELFGDDEGPRFGELAGEALAFAPAFPGDAEAAFLAGGPDGAEPAAAAFFPGGGAGGSGAVGSFPIAWAAALAEPDPGFGKGLPIGGRGSGRPGNSLAPGLPGLPGSRAMGRTRAILAEGEWISLHRGAAVVQAATVQQFLRRAAQMIRMQ